jgi:hypothetical protein
MCKCSINSIYQSKTLWTSQDAVIICHHLHRPCNLANVRVGSEPFSKEPHRCSSSHYYRHYEVCTKAPWSPMCFCIEIDVKFQDEGVIDFKGLGICAEKTIWKMKCKFRWKYINKIHLDIVLHNSYEMKDQMWRLSHGISRTKKNNSVISVRKRTISTERTPLVGEV